MKIKRIPSLDTKPSFSNLGEKIKQARKECGLSQEELAKQIGMKTAVGISLIESNKRSITPHKLYYISIVTKLPIDFFYQT